MRWFAIVLSILALQAAPARAARSESGPEMVAVVPPLTTLSGRVILKDGVTPVRGAEVLMTGEVDGEPRAARSDRSGRFRLRLPAGRYALRISRKMEVYEARAQYRVPATGRVAIDFLLLPDFEEAPGVPAARPPISSGPDARRDAPVVVGSVVDMMPSARPPRRLGRWAEALGFFGALLAVTLAAN